MSIDMKNQIKSQLKQALHDLNKAMPLNSDHLLVIGASTSEILGERIGTAGTLDAAEMIYEELMEFKKETGVHYAFQCCEHLNRALVMEKSIAKEQRFDQVTVTPVRTAGGSMATYAYQHIDNPVVVEFIKADAGIDIGDTFIGMHLKHVAVPVRSTIKSIGQAHLTMARTRPKLIGGERAVYPVKEQVSVKHECQ
ncbi:TIGR01440 family protein [Terrilactibacillus sp. BCM23-1]|uniref:UPF0340 protein GMB86_03045 n=1 Tax=Terrilactibacillus tamarindi TaxID=2599694 RepID=A0A6N8CM88_9BACI|nr:TIGR01440 family protein [Terrilactibacillus tamarindi]MTT30991.1 TIGR01440 family protein [Terrilactibacillus tamarindi]